MAWNLIMLAFGSSLGPLIGGYLIESTFQHPNTIQLGTDKRWHRQRSKMGQMAQRYLSRR